MDAGQKKLIEECVFFETGVIFHVDDPKIDGIRSSVIGWIDGYTSQNGPRFQIKPYGLKSHQIILEMGAFAMPCIQLIQKATASQYEVARNILKRTEKITGCKITIAPNQLLDSWIVTPEGFRIEITTRIDAGQYDDSTIEQVTKSILCPLIIALSELLGYNVEDPDIELEGETFETVIKRRERSKRNREVCLAVHGENCYACGFSTEMHYINTKSIIEVHHIEPLSKLEVPKKYNPREDLVPLCPNCHRAIHKRNPPLLPNELKSLILNNAKPE
jgi:5-methylcytosine-specific restriction protein A